MNDFLINLAVTLTTISKAFLVALKETTWEIGRIFREILLLFYQNILKSAKWLWEIYYHLETQILGLIIDLVLAFVAIRYLVLLLAIAVLLFYFNQWIFLLIYLIFIGIAFFRYFRIDHQTISQQAEIHRRFRDKCINIFRWPIRALASAILLYISWQLIEWQYFNKLSHKQKPEETYITEKSFKTKETHKDDDNKLRVEEVNKAEAMHKAEDEKQQRKITIQKIEEEEKQQLETKRQKK